MSKPKLIIHETDCHGRGCIHYNERTESYSYDDCAWGDVRATVQELIKIGFIKEEDVVIFSDDNEEDIYKYLDIAITNGLIRPPRPKEE